MVNAMLPEPALMSCCDNNSGPGLPDDATAPRVQVMLSVYNGAAFLAEQLDSLAGQSLAQWTLSWRDDGSSDDSPAIMQRFAESRLPGQVRRVPERLHHLGTGKSFFTLLAEPSDAELFAFCDQDDIWMPDKLERAANALSSVPADQPTLYCSRQILVDVGLKRLGLSPRLRQEPNFRNALAQNIASGCTLVMNKAARAAVLAAPLPQGVLHDWWSYLIVTGVGGAVLFDPHPSILYRQHPNNVIGAPRSSMLRARAALRRGPSPFMTLLSRHLNGLACCAGQLTPDARNVLAKCQTLYAHGFFQRLRALVRAGLHRQSLLENLILLAWVSAAPLPPAGEAGLTPSS